MSDKTNPAFYQAFVLEPDGQPIPQSSSPQLIAAMLELLEVKPGAKILEIGTGSGYSTAILANLTGSTGLVVSMDIDPALVERASRLLSQHGIDNVKVIHADGWAGHPQAAPFDRIIVWATSKVLAPAWIQQAHLGGLIVAPVQLLPLTATKAVVRVRVKATGEVVGERMIKGAFVPLSSQPLYQWHHLWMEEADVAVVTDDQPESYISAEWLQSDQAIQDREMFISLLKTVVPKPNPLSPEEDAEGFRAYLLATYPRGFTTGFMKTQGHAIGCSCSGSLALLFQQGGYVEAGERIASAALQSWIESWRKLDRPGYEELQPVVEPDPQGWRVRAALRTNKP